MDSFDKELDSFLLHDNFVRRVARRLVADAATADDVAQETWWAALRTHSAKDIRPWLAKVARNFALKSRRSETRRHDREARAAVPEAVQSTASLVERETVRKRIVEAVLALPDQLRDVVVLRWFDGLPPRAIARRTGEPVETVKSRLKRALALLRARLGPGESEDRARFGAALLALARVPGPGVVASAAISVKALLLGALVMTKATKILAAAAALILLLGGVAYFWRDLAPDDSSGAAARRFADAGGPIEGSGDRAVRKPGLDGIKSAAFAESAPVESAPAEPATGSLRVKVSFSDGTPAADVAVSVGYVGSRWADGTTLELRTDSEGIALFRDLPPGTTSASADRGGSSPSLEIEPGKQTEHAIKLERGIDISGVVVDEQDAPVEGADIILEQGRSHHGGRPVAKSGKDGAFRVRSVQFTLGVGARAPGYAPSDAAFVPTGRDIRTDADQLRLVLRRGGGMVRGRVLGPNRQPVAGAAVLLGAERSALMSAKLPDGRSGMRPTSFLARTGADGRFRLDCLPARLISVSARARGCAVWRGSVTPAASGSDELVIRLDRGMTVTGVVTNAAGRPVKDATIRLGEWSGFESSEDWTDANGAYRLNHLPAGEIQLVAEGAGGRAQAVLRGAVDQTIAWNPTLTEGLVIQGRAVDADGKPRGGRLHCERESDGWWVGQQTWTDETGRFRWTNLEDVPHRVVFEWTGGRGPSVLALATLTGVRPGGGEVVLVVPAVERTCDVRGRVVDSAGKPVAGANVSPWNLDQRSAQIELTGSDGQFHFIMLLPGRYRVDVHLEGFPFAKSADHAVAPGETWDAGDIVLEAGGRLRANLQRSDGGAVSIARLTIRNRDGSTEWSPMVKGDVWESGLLRPGAYELLGGSAARKQEVIPFEVVAGEITKLDVVVDPGVTRTLEIRDDGPQISGLIRVYSTKQMGLCDDYVARKGSEPFTFPLTLDPGTYDLEIEADSGHTAKVTVVIADRSEARGAIPVLIK